MAHKRKFFSLTEELAKEIIGKSKQSEKVKVYLLSNRKIEDVNFSVIFNREKELLQFKLLVGGLCSSFTLSFDDIIYMNLLNSLEGFTARQNLCEVDGFVFKVILIDDVKYLDIKLGENFKHRIVLTNCEDIELILKDSVYFVTKTRYHFNIDQNNAYLDVFDSNIAKPFVCINFNTKEEMDLFNPKSYFLDYILDDSLYLDESIALR